MLTCHKCGRTETDQNARYCARCGKALSSPESAPAHEPGQRISGVLILPAVAIILCPLINLLLLLGGQEGSCPAFLQNLLNSGPATIILDTYAKISTAVLLVLSVLVAAMFFGRKTKAPLACLALFALYAADNLIMALWMNKLPFARYEIASIVTAKFLFWGVLAYFWWGYISVSQKVRATFVN